MTTCPKCYVVDPPCGFYSKDRTCKRCRQAIALEAYHRRMQDPAFREAEKLRKRRREKARHAAGRVYNPDWRLSRYGITAADRQAMVEQQQGRCAICERTAPLHIDHDHTTGTVRALLCSPCNLMLGHAHEDVTVLQAAIAYLTNHSVPEGP